MAIDNEAIQDFIEAIKPTPVDTNSTYSAIVSRIDDEGTVWVYLAGSNKDTPTANTSAEVEVGDSVNVEWRNNKLYIAGNYSNPSAGAIRVNAVEIAAQVANSAAQSAVADAGVAREAAESVKGIAEQAQGDAAIAKTAANTSLTNLSQVQEVLEVARWIAEHGTYAKATLFNPNSTYYTITATQVTEPSDTDLDSQGVLIYYELDNGIYVRTTDTSVDDQKTYYRVTGTPVAQPDAEHIADYYTLAVSEAMSNYIQSHLALTNEGLYVMADDSNWKVLVGSEGVDIIDGSGVTDIVKARFDSDSVTFYDGLGDDTGNVIADFGVNGVVIGSENSTSIGKFNANGFSIEDDKLLTVVEIGKGEVITNRYLVEELIGDTSALSSGERGISRGFTYGDFKLNSPIGEISCKVPWKKLDSDGSVSSRGVCDFNFVAGETSTQYDEYGVLTARYMAGANPYIRVSLASSEIPQAYKGYGVKTQILSRRLTKNSSYTLSLINKSVLHCRLGGNTSISVRCRIKFENHDVLTAREVAFTVTDSTKTTDTRTVVVSGYTFVIEKRSYEDEHRFSIKWTNAVSESYGNPILYDYTISYDYNGIIADGPMTIAYNGTMEAPYYNFGNRLDGAKGAYSLAVGQGLKVENPYGVAIGKYNADGDSYAIQLGNGSEGNPSNAFTVDWDGTIQSCNKDYERDAGGSTNAGIEFVDKNVDTIAYVRAYTESDGQGGYNEGFNAGTNRDVNGTTIWHGLRALIDANGEPHVSFNHPKAWRTGLGLGSFIIADTFYIEDIQIGANTTSGNKTKDVTKAGYTPLMIQVSLGNATTSGANVSWCVPYYQVLSGNTVTLNIANRRTDASAKIRATITVLYRAN